jgi:hypothetical protein
VAIEFKFASGWFRKRSECNTVAKEVLTPDLRNQGLRNQTVFANGQI